LGGNSVGMFLLVIGVTGGHCRRPKLRRKISVLPLSQHRTLVSQLPNMSTSENEVMEDSGHENGPNGISTDSFSRTGVPTNPTSQTPTSVPFFLDPSLVSPMSAPDLAEGGAQSPYKTNLGLLVDAMETSDKPGSSRSQQQTPNATANSNSSTRSVQDQSEQNAPQGDARMRSLLAASLAVSPPAGYNVSSARTISQDQAPATPGLDKV
jgi:hypothetical protein